MVDARVVVVVPEANLAYREKITAPALRSAFPEARTVEAVVNAALNRPERDFGTVCQPALADAVRESCGEAVARWSRYHGDRYGW